MAPLPQKIIAKRNNTSYYDEDQVDDELFVNIGKLMMQNPTINTKTYVELANLLNRPTKELQSNLRANRARLAMALLPRAQAHLMEFTGRYYKLHQVALDELERRVFDKNVIAAMEIKDLTNVVRLIGDRMSIIERYVGVAPTPEKVIEHEQAQNPAGDVVAAILALHATNAKQVVANAEVIVAEDARVISEEPEQAKHDQDNQDD